MRNTPKRPWHNEPNLPDHVTDDEMVAAMGKVGVDGAIFIAAFSKYQYDASYAVEVQQAYPAGSSSLSRSTHDPAVWGLATHPLTPTALWRSACSVRCTSPRMPALPGARSRVDSARSAPLSWWQTNPDRWTDDETHP
jgi:hypothetical protein